MIKHSFKNKSMKVVAIKDAVIVDNKKWPNGTYQAYFKGDIFEISNWIDDDKSIVYKDGIHERLIVTEENFVTLEEWREIQLKELGI